MIGTFPARFSNRWKFAAALALAAGAARGGPFGDEYSGLPGAGLTNRPWISAVVSFEPSPTAGSGGLARNDLGAVVPVSNAVVGCPHDFGFGALALHAASLGNGGRITVTFARPINDGDGPDFAVFENGFTDYSDWTGTSREGATNSFCFAELALVEVSSDLAHWAAFPVTCLNTGPFFHITDTDSSRYASQDPAGLDGFAGKHAVEQGTPFDLHRLTNDPAVASGAVNLALVRYVRLTDVVGDGSFTDATGRAVFDSYYDALAAGLQPYPAFDAQGFDLRGIAVLNEGEAQVAATAGGPAISCEGIAHTVYQLQHAASPAAAEWTPLATVTGRGERIAWTNPTAAACFRVARWAAP